MQVFFFDDRGMERPDLYQIKETDQKKMFDGTRLLVAYTNESTTCRTPHMVSDLLTALRTEDTTLKRMSVANGLELELVVNGSTIFVRAVDAGSVSVRHADKFVLASCARTALVPVSIEGASLLPLFLNRYSEGKRLTDLDTELTQCSHDASRVQWDTVPYVEVSPIVDAIRLLIPPTSVA